MFLTDESARQLSATSVSRMTILESFWEQQVEDDDQNLELTENSEDNGLAEDEQSEASETKEDFDKYSKKNSPDYSAFNDKQSRVVKSV